MSSTSEHKKLDHLQTNCTVDMEILSPVHVGAGREKDWKKGLDYFVSDGRLYVVDKDQLCETLMGLDQGRQSAFDQYVDLLGRGEFRRIEQLIETEDIDLEAIALQVFDLDATGEHIPKEIKTVIRDGNGRPYIPGSSIKGAIRSVLFHHLFQALRPPRYDKKFINKDLLGDFETGIMRYILPGDALLPSTEIAQVELFNLYRQGASWKSDFKEGGGFPFWIENFTVGEKGTFRLGIADGFLQLVEDEYRQYLPTHIRKVIPKKNPIQFLFNLINDYTHVHLRREIEFFEKYDQAEDTDVVLGNLDELLKLTSENPHSCILRLAFGSGFHGMTGDWRFPDHTFTLERPDRENLVYNFKSRSREPARYKSRRIADTGAWFAPMGFVKLTLPENMESINFTRRIKL